MLWSKGSQGVGHDWVPEQQQQSKVAAEFAEMRGVKKVSSGIVFFSFCRKHRGKRRETNMVITWIILPPFFSVGTYSALETG